MGDSKYVITIAREFGSLGRPIAKKMSQQLGINFYDRDIFRETAKEMGLSQETIKEEEESARRMITNPFAFMAMPLGGGTTEIQNRIYEQQAKIIRAIAERETCIIVGRCSDYILEDRPDTVKVFIYAPYRVRVDHCVNDLGMELEEAKKMIVDVDRARDAYHMNYAGYYPGDKHHFDIMIDSSLLGVDGTADYLCDLVKKKFGE